MGVAKDDSIIAVDLGGTNIKSALLTGAGELIRKESTPTGGAAGKERVIENILEAVRRVAAPGRRLAGIGIGSPGWVNCETGEVNWIENIPALNGVNLVAAVGAVCDCPVYIDNDATNATRGEFLFGAGRGAKNFMGVTLGTGVGGGLILDGRVFTGSIHYAGEIGHVTYIPEGMACSCGKRGCLEAYASATAIRRAALSIQKRRIGSKLLNVSPEDLDARLVCDLAREGDEACRSIVYEAGGALGVVIGGVINLLNLDRVAIGGGVAAAGEILLEPVRLYASRHALPYAFECAQILPADLGNDAGLYGAAALVLMNAARPEGTN